MHDEISDNLVQRVFVNSGLLHFQAEDRRAMYQFVRKLPAYQDSFMLEALESIPQEHRKWGSRFALVYEKWLKKNQGAKQPFQVHSIEEVLSEAQIAVLRRNKFPHVKVSPSHLRELQHEFERLGVN